MELVYEGEQEGPYKVANILISKSIKRMFENYFPTPDSMKRSEGENPYQKITNWFSKGNDVDLMNSISNQEYGKILNSVPGLQDIIKKYLPGEKEENQLLFMEFLLHGLAEYSLLSKFRLEKGLQFKDMLSTMFTMPSTEDGEDDFDDEDKYT